MQFAIHFYCCKNQPHWAIVHEILENLRRCLGRIVKCKPPTPFPNSKKTTTKPSTKLKLNGLPEKKYQFEAKCYGLPEKNTNLKLNAQNGERDTLIVVMGRCLCTINGMDNEIQNQFGTWFGFPWRFCISLIFPTIYSFLCGNFMSPWSFESQGHKFGHSIIK